MSVAYQAVGWNRQKRFYDGVLMLGVVLYLGVFVGLGAILHPEATAETLLIRGLGTAALVLLHVILAIGPASRLDRRFLPWLYNRRHLGVTMFVLGLAHGLFAIFQFHAFGDRNPLVSLLVSNTRFDSLAQFPFELFGVVALGVLFLVAATSHDFWLANLTAPVWKALHMLVYFAYGALILHVVLGSLQQERHPLPAVLLGLGMIGIFALHLVAGWRERDGDEAEVETAWVDVGPVTDIPTDRARIVPLAGERVAVFRYDGKISAISNVCKHQNGPLGEGKIVDGCVVCPWHGYQYRPDDGASPPPFTEKVPTFRVRVVDGHVQVDPRPLPPGTRVEPARVDADGAEGRTPDQAFYVGYEPKAPKALAPVLRRRAVMLLATVALVAAGLTAGQGPFANSSFEFGVVRPFAGVVRLSPHPQLEVEAPGGGISRFHLVALGKHGADAQVADLDNRAVTLDGSLIYRDGETMIEVVTGSVRAAGAPDRSVFGASPVAASQGVQTLRGEIVDAKCHLGVMKPGEGKPHRACAVRCISGGVPPLFVARDADGPPRRLLLVGPDGGAVGHQVLDFVAEPIEVTGEVLRRGDQWLLRADPATFQRLR